MARFPLGTLIRSSVVLLLFGGSVFLLGCGGGETEQSTDAAAQKSADSGQMASSEPAAQKEPVEGLCIYQGAPVRKDPGPDGEYMAGLNVGESLTFLNETEEAERSGDMKEYSKVRLKGGDEGWVRSDMIAADADPAAVLRKTVLHERPTPMASTEKSFRAMDVVAVLDTQDAWVKVRGVRRGESWWDTGWVKPEVLTQKKTNVAVAGLWKKAKEKQDSTERREAVERITGNPTFEESVFVDSLNTRLDADGTF